MADQNWLTQNTDHVRTYLTHSVHALRRLKYYTFLDNQAAILRKVAMLGMCAALTVSAAAPPLYPGGGGGEMENSTAVHW